jgi:hypothetical protein
MSRNWKDKWVVRFLDYGFGLSHRREAEPCKCGGQAEPGNRTDEVPRRRACWWVSICLAVGVAALYGLSPSHRGEAEPDKRADGPPKRWAWYWVLLRLASGIGALLWAVHTRKNLVWIPLGFAVLLVVWVFWITGRITLRDMMNRCWSTRQGGWFLVLVFMNLVEVIVDVAAVFAAVESSRVGPDFARQIQTPYDALLAALSPFGASSAKPLSPPAQLATILGLLLILFMLVVVIGAAVNNYRGVIGGREGNRNGQS